MPYDLTCTAAQTGDGKNDVAVLFAGNTGSRYGTDSLDESH